MTCTICRQREAVKYALFGLGYCEPCAADVDRFRAAMEWPPLQYRTERIER